MSSRGERPVLVVEDESDTRQALVIVLADEGYAVRTATNGADALALLREGIRPCVIVLDMRLPIMGGEEMLHAMAEDAELGNVPVIVTSGKGGREPVPAYPNVRAILRKPFPFVRLLREIAEACGGEREVGR